MSTPTCSPSVDGSGYPVDRDGVTVGVSDGVVDNEGVGVTDGEPGIVDVTLGDGDTVWLGDTDGDGEGLRLGDTDGDGDGDFGWDSRWHRLQDRWLWFPPYAVDSGSPTMPSMPVTSAIENTKTFAVPSRTIRHGSFVNSPIP
jgi:hypothetical protein